MVTMKDNSDYTKAYSLAILVLQGGGVLLRYRVEDVCGFGLGFQGIQR